MAAALLWASGRATCLPRSRRASSSAGVGVCARLTRTSLPLLRATTRAAPSASSSKKGDDERLAVGTLAGSLAFGLAMSASGVGYDDALPLAVRC